MSDEVPDNSTKAHCLWEEVLYIYNNCVAITFVIGCKERGESHYT